MSAAHGIEEEEEEEGEGDGNRWGHVLSHHCLGVHRQLSLLGYAVDHLLSLLEDSLVHLLQGSNMEKLWRILELSSIDALTLWRNGRTRALP